MTPFALHLLRHGEPELAGRMLGRTDCAVTAGGIVACVAQAGALLGDHRPGAGALHVVSSDLIRARTCAEAIAAPHNLALTVDPRWRELDFGDWDGLAAAAIDPPALGRFWADPDAAPPPNGERWSALVARVGAAIATLDARPTLVVSHGGAIRAALAVLCGFDQRQLWAFDLPYACLVSLRVWPDRPRVAQIIGLHI